MVRAAREGTEEIRWWRPEGVAGIEVLSASKSPRLWKIFHDTYTVCTVTDLRGDLEWQHRGRRHVSARGSLMLIDAGEAHQARRRMAPISFWALMVEPSTLATLAEEVMGFSRPRWSLADLRDPGSFAAFQELHGLLASESSSLEKETALTGCLARLLRSCTESSAHPVPAASTRGLERAKDYLEAHALEEVTLARLSGESGLSRTQVCRHFGRAFGLPPHQYQLRLRLATARRWLARGHPFTAPDLGFCDQPQFIREFKREAGVTPGEYARQVR